MKRYLEVVVGNKEEAIIAEKAGADRIEISTSPEKGGLTVNLEDIASIIITVDIPSYIMIRPTSATYEYTEEEFSRILHTIELCKLLDVKGISVGFLKDGKIDRDRLEKILLIKGDLEVVFNRAIDSVINYEEELEYLNSLKEIIYIQTSGSAQTAFDGRHRFAPLLHKYKNKLVISSGLTSNTIIKLLEEGVDCLIFQLNSGVRINEKLNSFISYDKIKEIRNIIDK